MVTVVLVVTVVTLVFGGNVGDVGFWWLTVVPAVTGEREREGERERLNYTRHLKSEI